jgi:Ca-activated chloride channel family protein
MDQEIAARGTEMIHFAWPWMFLLLPLPLLLWRWLPPATASEEAALRVPHLAPFATRADTQFGKLARPRLQLWIGALAWLLLVTAVAQPLWIGDPLELPVSGRDLMLAVDVSGSMQTEDFDMHGKRMNRLEAIQQIAGQFIERRVGDRLGLILFGTRAYLQTPLTFDRKTVNAMLQESAIGLAGTQTAIGDAIGLAVKQLVQHPEKNRVLILLTDGVNDAGEVDPLKAAELAAKEGLTIYTIGIGADQMDVQTFFGTQKINPSADLDEKSLTKIAEATGGRYFRARDTEQLDQIYAILDKLQPVDRDKHTFRPRKSLFYWPLSGSLLLAGLLLLSNVRRK